MPITRSASFVGRFTHADNVGAPQIERMRHLGMNLQMRSISVLGNRDKVLEAFGDVGYDIPPLRLVQESGIPFGLGTDGTKANQISPFVTLWWAVTGRALNGEVVMRQTPDPRGSIDRPHSLECLPDVSGRSSPAPSNPVCWQTWWSWTVTT